MKHEQPRRKQSINQDPETSQQWPTALLQELKNDHWRLLTTEQAPQHLDVGIVCLSWFILAHTGGFWAKNLFF